MTDYAFSSFNLLEDEVEEKEKVRILGRGEGDGGFFGIYGGGRWSREGREGRRRGTQLEKEDGEEVKVLERQEGGDGLCGICDGGNRELKGESRLDVRSLA